MNNVAKYSGISAVGIAVVFVLSLIGGSFYTVDDGERGVELRNGKVTGVSGPGLNYKLPFIDSVVNMSIRDTSYTYEGDRMSTYSNDSQLADITISVIFQVDPNRVDEAYSEYGSIDDMRRIVLDPLVPTQSKAIFSAYKASEAIKNRPTLIAEVSDGIKGSVDEKDTPLKLIGIQVESIAFSDEYNASIEEQIKTEVSVLKEKAESDKAIEAARGVAESNLKIALAEAEATKARGEAEAESINARGKALRDNPILVDLIAAEKWDGKLPTSMIPGSTVPFINVGEPTITE